VAANTPSVRIGILGNECGAVAPTVAPALPRSVENPRGCGLWAPGYASSLGAAGAVPVLLGRSLGSRSIEELFGDLHGIVYTGNDPTSSRYLTEGEQVCAWCRQHAMPILAVDQGMQLLNLASGGTLYLDLPRELPEALQHRHPPERGLRHAITVSADTCLARFYGEGEIVVNSEHRRAINRIARGFVVSARALDGVVEAIEYQGDWFALGVQWQPASESASGLDIQLFRGLVEACQQWAEPRACPQAA
jgi:putative glutamine amidotransferase